MTDTTLDLIRIVCIRLETGVSLFEHEYFSTKSCRNTSVFQFHFSFVTSVIYLIHKHTNQNDKVTTLMSNVVPRR